MNEAALDQLSASRFSELVQTPFRVTIEADVALDLQLVTVTTPRPGGHAGGSSAAATFESFSLVFNGPLHQPLAQRTYRFAHERLGTFDLFIVPVGADSHARQYEAVFNRRLVPVAVPRSNSSENSLY